MKGSCVCVSSCNFERPADTLGILQRIVEIGGLCAT